MPLTTLTKSDLQAKGLSRLDALILCGGKGERLSSVISDRPKVMAEIHGKPFLEIIIEMLISHGFERIILSVGHLKNQVVDHFRNYKPSSGKFLKIDFSEENRPLGTGGAIKKAASLIESDHFLVMNGDVLVIIPLRDFFLTHLERRSIISILLSKVPDARAYGRAELAEDGRILNFREKDSAVGEGLVNAGVYLMRRDIFNHMPEEEGFSLEYDLLPKVLEHYCHGFVTDEEFIDIGTPERYEKALQLFANNPPSGSKSR